MTGEGVFLGEGLVQPGEHLGQLLLVVVRGPAAAVATQGCVDDRPGSGPTHAQVDTPGEHRLQLLEHLGNLERTVDVQQYPARSHPDPRGLCRCCGDEDLGEVCGLRVSDAMCVEPATTRALGYRGVCGA